VDDHDDIVAKAISWALRELIVHDPAAVRDFLERYADQLAARVKREVKNKLETGLKNATSAMPRTRRSKAGRHQPRTQLSRREADRQ
jgi:3-methyladenine DNA glycosylase AlkD